MNEEFAINLVGSSTKNERVKTDFYPTPANVTHALMTFLQLEPCTIWEPACGDGAMSRVLESYGHIVHSTDLREDCGYGLGGVDYLDTEAVGTFGAIITNPPFKLASEFILKSLENAPIVAMLLKSQVWHSANKSKLFEENRPAYVLPLNWRPDFLDKSRGGSPVMECLWTVWIKGETDTRYRILHKPKKGDKT